MSEVNNGQKREFKPRPKPTLSEVKESGTKNVVGITPRPKPVFPKKTIPPRPVPKVQNRPKPPMPKVQDKSKEEKQEVKQNNNVDNSTFQAYNNMLNNMQLMNAIGLVNGIYQNAQNNSRGYDRSNNLDKQTLFEEFYDYLTAKMQKDGILSLNDLKKSEKDDGYGDENNIHTAVIKAKKEGLSLEQFLEKMCNEDEFIKFNLEPLKVENLNLTNAIVSAVPFVRVYEYGKTISVEEYTNQDYQNLINQNYVPYLTKLKQDPGDEVVETVQEEEYLIKEPPKEDDGDKFADVKNVEDIEKNNDKVSDGLDLNKEVESLNNNDLKEDDEDADILRDLYGDQNDSSQKTEEELQNLVEDISDDNKKQEKEAIKERSDKEQQKILSMKDQTLVDFLNNDYDKKDEDVLEQENQIASESGKYDDFVYNILHFDEIQKRDNEYNKKRVKLVTEDNDKLKNQIAQLRNIVGDLKNEVNERDEVNEKLKHQYEIVSTKNKEKDKTIAETNDNVTELERGNQFLKDVVQSLLSEVEELKAQIAKQERLSKAKEKVQKSNFEIVAPLVDSVSTQEKKVEDITTEVTEEENANKQENYLMDNLTQVSDTVFDNDTYNVDGIIVDEEGLEVSGHFVDKIKNATDDIKNVYNEIRNELMSYRDVKGRCSSACDTFRLNGSIVAKFLLIGKTIKLYLALNPNDEKLPQNIYHQKDESKKKAYKETPFMVRLQSDLAVRKAKKLIEYMFDELDVNKNSKYEYVDYANTLERQVIKNK